MKRFAASMFFLSSVLASPVGNPSFPELLSKGFCIPENSCVDFRLGYEGDFVGDARMKQTQESSGRVDHFTQDTNSGTVTLNFFDRLDIYGVFGSTRICADWRFNPDDALKRAQLQTGYQFLWAVGARGVLYNWGKTTLGLGGRYSASNPHPSWIAINGTPEPVNGAHLQWDAWQVDLDLSYQIEIFIPYIGVKYLDARVKTGSFPEAIASNGSGSLHMRNRMPVGMIVGCTLSTGSYFMLNVEARLIDEEAATISGDLRF